MATARFLNGDTCADGLYFELEAECDARLVGQRPVLYPGKDLGNVVLVDADELRFEYLSTADLIQKAAEDFTAGRVSLDGLHWRVDEWFSGKEVPQGERGGLLEAIAAGKLNVHDPEDHHHPCSPDCTDSAPRCAAEAIEPHLPPWASVEQADDGGPGTGYIAWRLVLRSGAKLSLLRDYLQAPSKASSREDAPEQLHLRLP